LGEIERVRQALALCSVFVALVAASAAGAAAPTLPGTYTTKISGKQPALLNGERAIQIQRNGAYVILKRVSKTQGKVEVRGKALLNPERLVAFTKETGPLACKVTGKYRWTRTGKRLTFVRLHDTCVGRRAVLSGTFRKVA
jgi:hypothetical protein